MNIIATLAPVVSPIQGEVIGDRFRLSPTPQNITGNVIRPEVRVIIDLVHYVGGRML